MMLFSKRYKLPIWVLPLAIAGLVALLGWWGNDRLRATIEDELKTQLSATLHANVTALGIWSVNQTRLATSLVDDEDVRDSAVAVLLAPPAPRRDFRLSPELQQFASTLRLRLPQLGYGTAQLVNTNFVVVANSLRSQFAGNNEVSDAHI